MTLKNSTNLEGTRWFLTKKKHAPKFAYNDLELGDTGISYIGILNQRRLGCPKKKPTKLGSIGGALIAAFRIFGISIMFLFSLVLHILFTNIKL